MQIAICQNQPFEFNSSKRILLRSPGFAFPLDNFMTCQESLESFHSNKSDSIVNTNITKEQDIKKDSSFQLHNFIPGQQKTLVILFCLHDIAPAALDFLQALSPPFV